MLHHMRQPTCSTLLVFFYATVCILGVSSLRLTTISVPSRAIVGDQIWLNCSYDLEKDQLYSIKWYKDSEEIYRFLQSVEPAKTKFEAVGFSLDLSKSNYGNVLLSITDPRSQGDYRCEVLAETPSFQTVSETKTMKVYRVSSLRPTTIIVPSTAIVGDQVWLNCSYHLEKDQLYTIKWYKDSEEIYLYHSLEPKKTKFEAVGLNLDLAKSNYGNVLMNITDHQSQGDYRCEVSAETPSFQTVSETKTMKVYRRHRSFAVNMDQSNSSARIVFSVLHCHHYLFAVAIIVYYPYAMCY